MFDKIENLEDLFELKLQGLYDAENQLVKALPKMAAGATDQRLRIGIEKHLRETENQVKRLEQIAQGLDLSLDGPSIDEGQAMMALGGSDEVTDAIIIASSQGVEHYEISQYGTAVHLAKQLGYGAEADLLQATLDEEKHTDEMLNQLAISSVNEKAMS
jgi:ferritin-like metal-binding protein YciE